MSTSQLMKRLYYFTIEDESMLAEAFAELSEDIFAVTFKVDGTKDVFVTTSDTRDAMDRGDVQYNLLAEEPSDRIAIYHSPLSREELGDHEDAVKALALAYRAIAVACVGVNGEGDLGFDLSESIAQYTYITAPAGHTFILRLFRTRDDAREFVDQKTLGDKEALAWADAIPLASSDELAGFH